MEPAPSLWPWLVYFIVVLLTVSGMLGLSYVLGQRHSDPNTGTPYESGIIPTGSARLRFPADFYVVALMFIIFDVESVFIIAWAVGAKTLGWAGFVEAALFIVILGIALLYVWRGGALDCRPSAEKKRKE